MDNWLSAWVMIYNAKASSVGFGLVEIRRFLSPVGIGSRTPDGIKEWLLQILNRYKSNSKKKETTSSHLTAYTPDQESLIQYGAL